MKLLRIVSHYLTKFDLLTSKRYPYYSVLGGILTVGMFVMLIFTSAVVLITPP